MANHPELCEEVVEYLNGLSLSVSFTATRVNNPVDELIEAGGLAVVVFPGVRASTQPYRGDAERSYVVSVLVVEKIQQATTAASLAREDALIGLCEEIEVSMERRIFVTSSDVRFAFMSQESEGAGIEPMQLEEARYGSFASVIS